MKKTTAIGAIIVRIVIHGTFLTTLYLVAIMVTASALRTWPGLNIAGMPLALTILVSVLLYVMVAVASVKAGLNVLLLEPMAMVLPIKRPQAVWSNKMAPIYPPVPHEYPFRGKSHKACKPCKLASAQE